ncbi:MAG: sulfotransferase [Oceanicaulis sp.]
MKALTPPNPASSSRRTDIALPELMDEAKAFLAQSKSVGRRPLASIHHLACTGGTLFAKALATMPNVSLISELDPFTDRGFRKHRPRFAPADIIGHLNYVRQDLPEQVKANAYEAALRSILGDLTAIGLQLIIRDHAHSHYCMGESLPERTTHASFLKDVFGARSVVTVRDPTESWQSLGWLKWVDFSPATFDEYCKRYNRFLDDHEGLPVFRYEDFVAQPETVMRDVCGCLGIPYSDSFTLLISAVAATGDSGRKGASIAAREPKPVPRPLREEMAQSEAYARLCARLGY